MIFNPHLSVVIQTNHITLIVSITLCLQTYLNLDLIFMFDTLPQYRHSIFCLTIFTGTPAAMTFCGISLVTIEFA